VYTDSVTPEDYADWIEKVSTTIVAASSIRSLLVDEEGTGLRQQPPTKAAGTPSTPPDQPSERKYSICDFEVLSWAMDDALLQRIGESATFKKKGERKQWKAERREWLSYFETEETKLKKMRDERIEAVMEPMRVLKRGEVELLAGDAADESSSRRSERDATLKLAAMTHAKMLAQRARDATAAQRCTKRGWRFFEGREEEMEAAKREHHGSNVYIGYAPTYRLTRSFSRTMLTSADRLRKHTEIHGKFLRALQLTSAVTSGSAAQNNPLALTPRAGRRGSISPPAPPEHLKATLQTVSAVSTASNTRPPLSTPESLLQHPTTRVIVNSTSLPRVAVRSPLPPPATWGEAATLAAATELSLASGVARQSAFRPPGTAGMTRQYPGSKARWSAGGGVCLSCSLQALPSRARTGQPTALHPSSATQTSHGPSCWAEMSAFEPKRLRADHSPTRTSSPPSRVTCNTFASRQSESLESLLSQRSRSTAASWLPSQPFGIGTQRRPSRMAARGGWGRKQPKLNSIAPNDGENSSDEQRRILLTTLSPGHDSMYEVPFVLSPTRSGHLGAACRNSFGLSRASADAASLKAMLNLKMNGPPPALNFAPPSIHSSTARCSDTLADGRQLAIRDLSSGRH
jgi:hypothetical protein